MSVLVAKARFSRAFLVLFAHLGSFRFIELPIMIRIVFIEQLRFECRFFLGRGFIRFLSSIHADTYGAGHDDNYCYEFLHK